MLTVSTVQVKLDAKPETLANPANLGELKSKYDNMLKSGGPLGMQMLTYHPPTKKFHYQSPTAFVPVNSTSKVLTVALALDEKNIFETEVSVVTKVLVQTNGVQTSVLVGALSTLVNNGIKVAYVKDPTAEKPEIQWLPIKRVYDPIKEAKDKANIATNNPPAAKVGRPKKLLAQEPPPRITVNTTFNVLKLDTRDGSLYVCDHLIMK